MHVADVMNPEPLRLDKDSSLKEAIEQLAAHEQSCLIVVDGSQAVGIVTERDATRCYAKGLISGRLECASLQELMTANPVCVQADTTYADALALSRSRKLRHLPVVDPGNNLIGVVTQGDLLDAYALIMDEQARLEDNIKELKLLSLVDPLMGIGNRRAMEVDLSFTDAEAKRHDKSYGLALFDIDYFKRYNDTYGHQKGDDALREVATMLKQTVRDSDRVYRYGGEEMLVLMPESTIEDASICAERVRVAVEMMAMENRNAPSGILTISVGVAAARAADWKSLVEAADQALYQAKETGRNKLVIAESTEDAA